MTEGAMEYAHPPDSLDDSKVVQFSQKTPAEKLANVKDAISADTNSIDRPIEATKISSKLDCCVEERHASCTHNAQGNKQNAQNVKAEEIELNGSIEQPTANNGGALADGPNAAATPLNAEIKLRKPRPRKPKLPKRDVETTVKIDSLGPQDLKYLSHVFKYSQRMVFIVGAGISVSAGIPDFRSRGDGLFAELKRKNNLKQSGKSLFDSSVYADPKTIEMFHETINSLHSLASAVQPTGFHRLMADISQEQRLLRCYTQNIDGLELRSGDSLSTRVPLSKPWPRVVQLHGSLQAAVCTKCHIVSDFDSSKFTGAKVPECSECTELDDVRRIVGKRQQGIGKVRPRVVLYNEPNPDSEAIGQLTEADLKAKPDALVVVGTTLQIPGVKRLVKEMSQSVRAAKGGVIWLSLEPPPSQFESCFDMIIEGDCQALIHVLEERVNDNSAATKPDPMDGQSRINFKRKREEYLEKPVQGKMANESCRTFIVDAPELPKSTFSAEQQSPLHFVYESGD